MTYMEGIRAGLPRSELVTNYYAGQRCTFMEMTESKNHVLD